MIFIKDEVRPLFFTSFSVYSSMVKVVNIFFGDKKCLQSMTNIQKRVFLSKKWTTIEYLKL